MKRSCKRVPVCLEAELNSDNKDYLAFIENISESGIYIKIASLDHKNEVKSFKDVNLKFRLPSGGTTNLVCKKIWANKNAPSSMIIHIGAEVIDPPQDYRVFYQLMRSGGIFNPS